MKIDFELTKVKFEESCLSQARLARKLGVSRNVMHQVLNGTYAAPDSKRAHLIYDELRQRDILVEVPDEAAA